MFRRLHAFNSGAADAASFCDGSTYFLSCFQDAKEFYAILSADDLA
jgi:hypothetical protein